MITINSRDFGTVEVSEDKVFTFPNGIFAFEESKQFALFSPLGGEQYPMWLQATEDINPCFIVFDPSAIDSEYSPALSQGETALLKATPQSNLKYLVIARVPEDFKETTVNMKSPIALNCDEKLAVQIILDKDYSFRLPIYKKEGND